MVDHEPDGAQPTYPPEAPPDLSPNAPPDLPPGLPPGLPGVLAVDHIGLAVADLDAAVRFHTEVLGLVCVHREVNEDQGVAEAMLSAPGERADAAEVQLVAPLDEGSAIARFLTRSGPGLQHLAYRVADVEAACGQLHSRGVRLLYDSPRAGTRGSRINFVHPKDAGGVLVELVEHGPDGGPRQGARVAHDPAGDRVAGG